VVAAVRAEEQVVAANLPEEARRAQVRVRVLSLDLV
jgi:hypothetical protein